MVGRGWGWDKRVPGVGQEPRQLVGVCDEAVVASVAEGSAEAAVEG